MTDGLRALRTTNNGVRMPQGQAVAGGWDRRPPALTSDSSVEDLRRRLRELEARNAELVEFAHYTAHDLKEPLATIGLFADTLGSVQGDSLDARGRRMLSGIRDGVDRMRATVDDALDAAQGSHDDEQQVDMGDVVEQALSAVQWRLERSSTRVEVAKLPVVTGDRSQLTRLMQNLLANALEFSETVERSWIVVDAQRQPDSWLFQVSDNGAGVQADEPERLFERFERGDRAGGVGLGLTICRAVVERHGGRISIQARPAGGTVVSFTLPVATSRPRVAPRRRERLRGV